MASINPTPRQTYIHSYASSSDLEYRLSEPPRSSITPPKTQEHESPNYKTAFLAISDIVDDLFLDEDSKCTEIQDILKSSPLTDSEIQKCLMALQESGYSTQSFCLACKIDTIEPIDIQQTSSTTKTPTKKLDHPIMLKLNVDELPTTNSMNSSFHGFTDLDDIPQHLLRFITVNDLLRLTSTPRFKKATVSTPTTEHKKVTSYRRKGSTVTLPSKKLGEGEGGAVFSTYRGTAIKKLPTDNQHSFMDLKATLVMQNTSATPELKDITAIDNYYHLEMELFESNLSEYILNHDLNSKDIINLISQLLSCVLEIHANGIVHHDLDPCNILVKQDSELNLKLSVTDFGKCSILKNTNFKISKALPFQTY